MKTVFIIFILIVLLSFQFCAYTGTKTDLEADNLVILLHGLARTSRSMAKLEKSLLRHGYNVININYPSTKYPIEFLSDKILSDVVGRYSEKPQVKIHFVTHSIGGIIVRYYLKHHILSNLGRAVMLSPPNKGSEMVNYFKNTFIFKELNGPAGQQLDTGRDSFPLKLGPVDYELGVITGNKSINLLTSMMIPGPDDGSIAVERAKVVGMSDFLVVPECHTFIMRSQEVIDQVVHFLQDGVFRHPDTLQESQ